MTLRKGWEVKKLGEVCKTSSGGTPLKSNVQYYQNGTIPWLLSGEVCKKDINTSKNFITQLGLDNSSAKIFPVNSVLIAMYGATAGQVGILRFPASSNQAVCAVYPNEKMDVNFIYYFFLYTKDSLVAQAVGNAQPNISQQKIKDTSIPIPPLPEQQRIVEILNEAFAGIDTAIANTQQAISNAKELFDTELNRIFSQRGEGWEVRKLGEVTLDTINLSPEKEPEKIWTYIDISSIDRNSFSIVSPKELLGKETPSRAKKHIQTGDILFATTRPNLKNIAVFELDSVNTVASTGFCVLRPLDKIVNRFLFYFVTTDTVQKQIEPFILGAAYPAITDKNLKKVTIPIPPLPEQQRIVERLDTLKDHTQALTQVYQQKLVALQELKQSLLHKAFTGELTANWEESA